MKNTFVIGRHYIKDFLESIIDENNILSLGYIGSMAMFSNLAIRFQAYGCFALRKLNVFDVEENTSFIQPIPYIVFKNSKGEYLLFKRITGDDRLVGGLTLGVGGHIDTEDLDIEVTNAPGMNFRNLVDSSITREVQEEVPWLSDQLKNLSPWPTALIYSKDTPVSMVHMGFVYSIQVPDDFEFPTTLSSEELSMEPRWYSELELRKMDLEDWSAKLVS